MDRSTSHRDSVTIIQPNRGWQIIDFKELKDYRDLVYFLIRRDIKAQYAQTILGLSWAIIQPLIQILLFTLVFGKIAGLPTDGIPYILFVSVGILPWTYMSQAMMQSGGSLVHASNILGKIYFPRLIFPITSVLARLVDFTISLVVILCLLLYYEVPLTFNLLALPLLLLLMVSVPISTGLWLSTLAVRFRDVQQLLPFAIRMLMFTAPIVYSASSIPAKYRILYSINPIVGVMEGFRACLLGIPMPWLYIWPGTIAAIILVITGAVYFRRMEHIVVDVM